MAENMVLKAILQFDSRKAITEMGKASVSFKRMEVNAKRVSEGAAKVGRSMTGLTMGLAPVAVGMGAAIKMASDYETQIAMIGTITDEAVFPTKKLEDANIALALTYGTGPTEQAENYYQAVSAGADTTEKAMARLSSANKLATAGNTQLAPTLTLMNTIMNTYGESGLSASDAVNKLFQTTTYGVTTIGQLGSSLGDVVPTANSLGVQFHELNAAIATATLRGAQTSEATTGLNMALVNVLKPTKDASNEAKRLNIEWGADAIKKLGFAKFLTQVIEKTGGSEESMTKLFGSVLGFKTIMKIAGDQGEKFNELVGKIGDAAGASDRAFQKMANTVGFKMKQLGAYAKVGGVLFGEVMTDSFMRLASPLSSVAKEIVNILQAVKTGKFEGLSTTAQAIAKGITEGIDTLRTGIEGLLDKVREARDWIEKTFGPNAIEKIAKWGLILLGVAAAAAPLLAIMAGLGFILPAIITFMSGVGSILLGVFGALTGPMGLVLVLGYGIYKLFESLPDLAEGFRDAWVLEIEDFSRGLQETWAAIKGVTQQLRDLFELGTAKGKVFTQIGYAYGRFLMWWILLIPRVISKFIHLGAFLIGVILEVGRNVRSVFTNAGVYLHNLIFKISEVIYKMMTFAHIKPPDIIREIVAEGPEEIGRHQFKTYEELGMSDIKEKAKKEKEKAGGMTELEKMMAEISDSSKKMQDAAQKQLDAAKAAANKKISVKVDGREVAKANAKAESDIQVRSGETATPWQQALVAIHGARPLARAM